MAKLSAGITKVGTSTTGSEWRILGHTYHMKAGCETSFSFETYDPPGTFVPPHIHPHQDEFIYVLEGVFDLYLDGQWTQAHQGDLVRMPMGLAHAYYNKSDKPARALFWVSPAGSLENLFNLLHDLADPELVVKYSAENGVDFLPPGSVEGA